MLRLDLALCAWEDLFSRVLFLLACLKQNVADLMRRSDELSALSCLVASLELKQHCTAFLFAARIELLLFRIRLYVILEVQDRDLCSYDVRD